ncbi:MAG: hypothetical protein ACK6DT_15700 [Planctomycetota bacterium]
MKRTHLRCRGIVAAFATSTAALAQAVFYPIPNSNGVPGSNQNGCYVSGGASKFMARISADGSTVALKIYQGGFINGAIPGEFAIWTEAGGTQTIAPDTGYGANFGWGVSGVSSDGSVVYGSDWVWRRVGGYQSLASTLLAWGGASIFGCSDDGAVVAGFRPTNSNGLPYPGDYFRWQVGQPAPQNLPRDAQHPDGYFLFNCISGDGSVIGGHTWAPNSQFFQTYAAALVTTAGAQVITPESAGNATLVNDLSFDGSVAVGPANLPGPFGSFGLSAYRWTAAGGLQVLPVPGSASIPAACDALGNVVVGQYLNFGAAGTRAFRWNAVDGAVDLQTDLVNNQGLGAALQGWTLLAACDVSADGRAIVGLGRNPAGCEQAFLVRYPTTPAAVTSYGTACVGPQGALQLTAAKAPYIGAPTISACQGASAQALQLGVLGLAPIAVPLPGILPAGLPGCDLRVTPDVVSLLPVSNGVARQQLTIPAQPALIGQTYNQQVLRLDVSNSNGAITFFAGSNGLTLTIGAY